MSWAELQVRQLARLCDGLPPGLGFEECPIVVSVLRLHVDLRDLSHSPVLVGGLTGGKVLAWELGAPCAQWGTSRAESVTHGSASVPTSC